MINGLRKINEEAHARVTEKTKLIKSNGQRKGGLKLEIRSLACC